MNCDDAFDALTDPSQRDNAALRWHLELCPRCREMQQVLEPALAAMNPQAATAEPLPLPRWSGADAGAPFLTEDAVRVAETAAKQLKRRSRGWSQWSGLVVTLTALLLIAVGLATATPGRGPDQPTASGGTTTAEACLWTTGAARPETSSPRETNKLILSCVSCHLEGTVQ